MSSTATGDPVSTTTPASERSSGSPRIASGSASTPDVAREHQRGTVLAGQDPGHVGARHLARPVRDRLQGVDARVARGQQGR